MVKYKETSPTTPEEDLEVGITIGEFSISIWYTLDKSLNEVAQLIYSTTWRDNEDPAISYKAKPGTIREIKHRKSYL